MSTKPTLKGTIRISRVSGGGKADEIRVCLGDKSSGVEFAEARLSLEQFANATFGSREVECVFELRAIHLVGSIAENKTELVPFNYFRHDHGDKKAVAKALKPFEVDGWRAREGDMHNGHCREGTSAEPVQRVVFFRHVSKEGKPL